MQDAFFAPVDHSDRGPIPQAYKQPLTRPIGDAGIRIAILLQADPDSLLAWYKRLIQLKKTNPAMAEGSNLLLDTDNNKVLSWMRQKSAPKSPIAPRVNS